MSLNTEPSVPKYVMGVKELGTVLLMLLIVINAGKCPPHRTQLCNVQGLSRLNTGPTYKCQNNKETRVPAKMEA